jgi:PST family polysaccharide transporter
MKSELKIILSNSLYLYLIQGLNYLLPLLTLPYLLLTLSTESFGKYSYAFAFSQFIILFVDFGFNLTATKKIAENVDNEHKVKDIFWNILIVKFVFFLIAALVTIIATLFIDKLFEYREGIWISLTMVLGTVLFPIWWFQGLNKMKTLSLINACSKLLSYPLIFFLVKDKEDAGMAIFIQSLAILLAGLISIAYVYKNYRYYFKNFSFSTHPRNYMDEIKGSWPIFLSNSAISLYTNSLTLLLGFFSTPYNVGLFAAIERIVRVICFGVLGPINQACFPLLARLKQTDFAKAKKIFKMVLLGVTATMMVSFVSFIFFESWIVSKFLIGFDSNASYLLLLFMTMIFPIALGGVGGQLGLLALGNEMHKRKFSSIYLITGFLSIPCSILAIFYYQINGAIYSMLTVETVIFLVIFYYVKKYRFL